jgi:hypothetical protein
VAKHFVGFVRAARAGLFSPSNYTGYDLVIGTRAAAKSFERTPERLARTRDERRFMAQSVSKRIFEALKFFIR